MKSRSGWKASLGCLLALMLLVLPAVAQEEAAQEEERLVRVPTIEEIERERATKRPPLVLIDAHDARQAMWEMIDSADDDEAVFLYYKLYAAKEEHRANLRELAELQRRVEAQRERRTSTRNQEPRNER